MMSINLWASTYCFERSESLFTIKNNLKKIMLPDEDVIIDTKSNCLETAVRPYRESLISKYLRMNYSMRPELAKKSRISGQLCRFHIKKNDSLSKIEDKLNLGTKNNFEKSQVSETSSSVREILVSEGRVGLLTIEDENIYVKCEKYAETFGIELSLTSEFSQGLTTSLTLAKGEWINIFLMLESLFLSSGLSLTFISISLPSSLNFVAVTPLMAI